MRAASPDRPRHPIGPSGRPVPPLCIGCAPLGDMPETFGYSVSEEQALATLRAALASSIRFFDTAAIYGYGESERRIGRLLREQGGLPEGMVLATKADRDPTTGDFSGAQIRRSVEGSLERLGLQRLQLVSIHDPEHTSFETIMGPGGALEVLRAFQQAGVIDQIGISGGPIPLLIRYVETGFFSYVVTHNRYTLLHRAAAPLLDVAGQHGVAVFNAAPYGSGLLVQGAVPGARYMYRPAPDYILERTRHLATMCQSHGVPLAAAALQFSLRDPRITATIVGVTSPAQVAQTLDFATHMIPPALWTEINSMEWDSDSDEG